MKINFKKNEKLLKFSLVLIIFLIFGMGYLTGYINWVRPFKVQVDGLYSKNYLGNFIGRTSKKKKSLAYLDPKKAYENMDDYMWGAPHMMTPFVQIAPQPGNYKSAVINSMQFRSKKEVSVPKPSNTYRIFLTGGSTAFSSGAPSQDKTIGGYLESLLKQEASNSGVNSKFEVFTMAVPGWTTTNERIVIENRLSELQPDLIFSLSGRNDVHGGFFGINIYSHSHDIIFFNISNMVLGLFGKQPMPLQKVSERLPCKKVSYRLIKNVELISFSLSRMGTPYIFALQPTLSMTGKKLTDAEKSADQKNIKKKEKPYFIDCYDNLDKNLKKLKMQNFYYLNLTKVFDSVEEGIAIFLDSTHFGDRGNQILAQNIHRFIRTFLPNG